MLFNTYIFIFLFLPLSVAGYFLLCKTGKSYLPKLFLLGMSLWFYAYFNIKYLPIIVLSIIVNFFLCAALRKAQKRHLRVLLLIIGMTANIGVLFYYKYLGFFTENLNLLFKTNWNVVHLILPLGISFFTFQQVSFVVDCYRKTVPNYNFLDYALFVTFFPQLIAGPIVLHNEIIPQFADKQKQKLNVENFAKGFMAFTFGLSKKVLLADMFGNLANLGFGDIQGLDSTSALVSMLAYTLQIYFDFSGYCDMAIGIGLFFNIDIPQNFNSPYRALNIDDFWKRWHITLTRFLRTNVYFPLGGNRKGVARTYINMFIVFFISGLWHGANWTFILWGALHGLAIIITKLLSRVLKETPRWLKPALWFVTFAFINLTWIYFRADSVSLANQMISKIFSGGFGTLGSGFAQAMQTGEFELVAWILDKLSHTASEAFIAALPWIYLAFGTFASIRIKNTNERLTAFKPNTANALLTVLLFVWSIVSLSQVSTFLYFNF